MDRDEREFEAIKHIMTHPSDEHDELTQENLDEVRKKHEGVDEWLSYEVLGLLNHIDFVAKKTVVELRAAQARVVELEKLCARARTFIAKNTTPNKTDANLFRDLCEVFNG